MPGRSPQQIVEELIASLKTQDLPAAMHLLPRLEEMRSSMEAGHHHAKDGLVASVMLEQRARSLAGLKMMKAKLPNGHANQPHEPHSGRHGGERE
jgi:hypothetical protein